jgi:hypothetical protein
MDGLDFPDYLKVSFPIVNHYHVCMMCPKCKSPISWLDLFCVGIFCDCGATLVQMLKSAQEQLSPFVSYFFREHGKVFYVGSTEDRLYFRMREHMQNGGRLCGKILQLTFEELKRNNITLHISFNMDEKSLYGFFGNPVENSKRPGGGASRRCRRWDSNTSTWLLADNLRTDVDMHEDTKKAIVEWENLPLIHRRERYMKWCSDICKTDDACYPYMALLQWNRHLRFVSQWKRNIEEIKLQRARFLEDQAEQTKKMEKNYAAALRQLTSNIHATLQNDYFSQAEKFDVLKDINDVASHVSKKRLHEDKTTLNLFFDPYETDEEN